MGERKRYWSGKQGSKKGVPAQTTEVTPQGIAEPGIAPLTPSPPPSHGHSTEWPGIQGQGSTTESNPQTRSDNTDPTNSGVRAPQLKNWTVKPDFLFAFRTMAVDLTSTSTFEVLATAGINNFEGLV